MADYIRGIRKKVGSETILLNFVGANIVNEQDEILLQKRVDKNLWGFLGGAIEIGESAEEAIIREVLEESGLHIKVLFLRGVYTKYFDSYPNGDKAQPIVIFMECEVLSGDLDCSSDETIELKYFNKSEIPKLVNNQHEDILADIINENDRVLR